MTDIHKYRQTDKQGVGIQGDSQINKQTFRLTKYKMAEGQIISQTQRQKD